MCEITLSRARRLSSKRISRHGACLVSAASNIPNPPEARSVSPGDGDGDVARHASGIFDHLVADAILPRFQVIGPELKYFLWNARQRFLPAWFLLDDGTALVGTQRVGEPIHLYFRQPVSHRALDNRRGELDLFFLRLA